MDWQMLVTLLIVLVTFCLWVRHVFGTKKSGCHGCPQACQKPSYDNKSLVSLQDLRNKIS